MMTATARWETANILQVFDKLDGFSIFERTPQAVYYNSIHFFFILYILTTHIHTCIQKVCSYIAYDDG